MTIAPNKVTGPNAGGPRQFPTRTALAARVGQFWRWSREMKTNYLGILFMAVAVSAMADSVTFTRIQGGPPLPGVSDAEMKRGTIQGEDFTKIKPQIQKIIATLVKHERWLPKEAAWYDVGPDAGYMSAVVEMGGKKYAINSWYPSERSSTTIAVSETQGLVSVKSRKEKDAIEAKNTASYREIVSIFDFIPEPKKKEAPTTGGTVRR